MSDQMQTGMAEATRLTREGRLAEATEVIQRALRGEFSAADVPSGPNGSTIEVPSGLVAGASRPAAPARPDRAGRPLWRAPKHPRGFRAAPPGGTSGETVYEVPTAAPGGRFVEKS